MVQVGMAKIEHIDTDEIGYLSSETVRNAQTFPRDYDFVTYTKTNIEFICGMSVPPLMIKRLVTKLIEQGVYDYRLKKEI